MLDRIKPSVDRRSHQLCARLPLDKMIHVKPGDLAKFFVDFREE
jgi:hypothetical protein